MSEIAPVGSQGISSAPSQTEAGTPATQHTNVSGASTASSAASAMSIQETYQSVSMSFSSQVDMVVAQFSNLAGSEELARLLAILILLDRLLELLTGGNEDSQSSLADSLGQGQGANAMLYSASYSASFAMTSETYQMSAAEAYASSSTTVGQPDGTVTPDAVAPADAQGSMDAGDGGHQLDVVA